MYRDDHNPPHFHVRTADGDMSVRLSDFAALAGEVDRRAYREACDWVERHRDVMEEAWDELTRP